MAAGAGSALAEGSRTLYPASYPVAGFRGEMDLASTTNKYTGVVVQRQFIYVYANAGEYIVLGSSNRSTNANADIFVYNPQTFGTPGNETIPGTANFSCSGTAPAVPSGSYGGANTGYIASRNAELAGPNSADNSVTVTNGYRPCAYRAPSTGIYGVRFTVAGAGGSGATGSVATQHLGSTTVWGWEVQVRANATTTTDINGRVYTYALVATTGANSRPVYHSLYYVTPDGARYQQDMKGFDPNQYGLWGSQYGFLDNGQPLYRDIRGSNQTVSAGYPAELSAQGPQALMFLSDISPGGANATQVNTVLTALGVPLAPPVPAVSNVLFNGLQTGNQTYVGGGGTFSFTANNNTTYQIVISAGIDYDPANPLNATLTGLAPNGSNSVVWNGLANNGSAFPVGTFNFQVTGRNSEIHFPIVDDEGSKNGGPVLTKLNGTQVGDHTVFYDDRGYTTRDGVNIGTPNGLLCPANPPVPPTPNYSLLGQDSSAQTFSGPNCNGGTGTCYYRYWPSNGNTNTDCAASAGFGDAKALDLWAYQSATPPPATVVITAGNITLAKSAPASIALNTPFAYTIGLGNSSSAATGTTATVTDVLPAGVIASSVLVGTGVSAVNCGSLPSAPGATLTCTLTLSPALAGNAPNGTAVFTINATATAYGSVTNYAAVDPTGGGSPPAPGPGCTPTASCGSATTVIIAPPTITKSFTPTSIGVNGTSTLTLVINNPNPTQSLSGVAFSDPFPGGMSVANPASVSNTCGGTFAPNPGDTALSFSGGALAAGGSCTITVAVTDGIVGTAANTTGAISSTEGGTGAPSNTATLTVTAPKLTVAKTGPATATVGTAYNYVITVTNTGTAATTAATTVT
ncbi:MAG: hypothetical protein JSR27_04535, partial [Proteobacteria bacterium]|nr:hypothetical protein [Pseudomonadota bacterium]